MAETFSVQSGDDLTVGWREYISSTGSTQTSHWLNDGSQVVMTIDSSFDNRKVLVEEVLGYSKLAGTSLFRQLPMRPPDYSWMYATSVEMNGVNWTSKLASLAGPVSGYEVNRTRITFSVLPFTVLPNTSGNIVGGGFITLPNGIVVTINGGEWNRYVIKGRKPTTEFATTDRLMLKWAAGMPSTNEIKSHVGFKLPTVTLTWKWMWVPDRYVNDAYGNPVNVEDALGKVNDAWFAGYPPQTLYLDSIDYEPVNLPVSPTTAGIDLGVDPGLPPRVWNVTLNIKYREPPIDKNVAGANAHGYLVGSDRIAGHNLLPDLSKPIENVTDVANPPSAGLASTTKLGWFWYAANTVANAGGGAGAGGA